MTTWSNGELLSEMVRGGTFEKEPGMGIGRASTEAQDEVGKAEGQQKAHPLGNPGEIVW